MTPGLDLAYGAPVRRVAVASLLALTLGCERPVTRFALPLQDDTRSLLFAVESRGRLSLEAVDVEQSGPWIRFEAPEGEALGLSVLLYSVSLSQLGIRPGAVAEDLEGRKIPWPAAIMSSPSAPVIRWTASDALRGPLERFRIPLPEGNLACIELRGCLDPDGRCVIPCPEPTIAPVRSATVALPNFLPCPPGWMEREDSSVTYCSPWGESGAPVCRRDEVAFPGGGGCERIGSACPVPGPFAEPMELPPGRLVYVDRNAPDDSGDGSRTDPFATLGAALSALTETATVVLNPGVFTESVTLPAGVSLLGSCTDTVLEAPSRQDDIVVVEGRSGTIANLKLRGGRHALRAEGGDARVGLRDVVVEGTSDSAVDVDLGATVSATDLLVRDSAIGVRVDSGRLVARRVVTSSCTKYGLLVQDASKVDLRDATIRDTRRAGSATDPNDGDVAVGIYARNDTEVTLRRVTVEHNRDLGVDVQNSSVLDAEDLLILDTHDPSKDFGRGLRVWKSSVGTIRRLVIADSASWGFRSDFGQPVLRMEDVLILRSRGEFEDQRDGMGIVLWHGADMHLSRVFVGASADAGVWLGRGVNATLQDVTIESVRNVGGYWGGPGLIVDETASTHVNRLAIRNTDGAAVLADGAGEVRIERAILSGSGADAVRAQAQSTVTLNDVRVTDSNGVSLFANGGAQLSGKRCEVGGDHGGIRAVGAGTAVAFEDIVLLGKADTAKTIGAFVAEGAALSLRHFAIRNHGGTGVSAHQCALEANEPVDQLSLEDGVVEGHAVGVEVEGACIDANGLDAISYGVLLRDNARVIVGP